MIESILSEFNIKYCAVADDGHCVVILAYPYHPFNELGDGYGYIDSFYIASNTLYHLAKDIREKLTANGYRISDIDVDMKRIGERGGLGVRLNNQLLCNREYGTKMTLQAIVIECDYERILDEKVVKDCDNCNLCDSACPVGALSCGSFDRAKCIRNIQDFPDSPSASVGNRVLGCEECQRVCPHNTLVERIDAPSEFAELLRWDNLAEIARRGKPGMAKLRQYIGANYARINYIGKLINNVRLYSTKSML